MHLFQVHQAFTGILSALYDLKRHCLRFSIIYFIICRRCYSLHAMSLTTMHFLVEIMFILKALKSHFKGQYDKQNLKLVVISYKIYATCRKMFS